MTDTEWKNRAKGILKAELKKRSVTYEELAKRLTDNGIETTLHNLNIKMSRGTFSAVFFLQCLDVIGCKNLQLED